MAYANIAMNSVTARELAMSERQDDLKNSPPPPPRESSVVPVDPAKLEFMLRVALLASSNHAYDLEPEK
jgi:hypothetical protein